MQNSSNNLDTTKPKLHKALESVELSDRLPPQIEGTRTPWVKTPSPKLEQNTTDNKLDAELSLDQLSEDWTIAQVASHLPEAEAGNDNTIMQIVPHPNPQVSPPAIEPVNHVFLLPQTPREPQGSESASPPNPTVEAKNLALNRSDHFSSQDNSQIFHAAGITLIQNHGNISVPSSDAAIHSPIDQTIIQFSNSATHSPAPQTIHQVLPSSSVELNQTVHQWGKPSTLAIVPKNPAQLQLFYAGIFRDTLRASGSFTSRLISITGQFFHSIWSKIDLNQQSRFRLSSPLSAKKMLAPPSSSPINPSSHQVMASLEQPSAERYQRQRLELDCCRLAFAKELARNGKFRKAIAMAEQISETSHLFKDSQLLIRNWQKY